MIHGGTQPSLLQLHGALWSSLALLLFLWHYLKTDLDARGKTKVEAVHCSDDRLETAHLLSLPGPATT